MRCCRYNNNIVLLCPCCGCDFCCCFVLVLVVIVIVHFVFIVIILFFSFQFLLVLVFPPLSLLLLVLDPWKEVPEKEESMPSLAPWKVIKPSSLSLARSREELNCLGCSIYHNLHTKRPIILQVCTYRDFCSCCLDFSRSLACTNNLCPSLNIFVGSNVGWLQSWEYSYRHCVSAYDRRGYIDKRPPKYWYKSL